MKDKVGVFFYIDSITEKIQELEQEKIVMKKIQKNQRKKIVILSYIVAIWILISSIAFFIMITCV